MNSERYMAISPGAIIPGAMPSFKIYVLSPRGKYTLWALKGNKVTQEQLAKLSGGGFREVYVDVDEKFKYEQYLETYLGDILESSWPNDDDKAAIFSKVSANVVKSAFESSLGFGAHEHGRGAADAEYGQKRPGVHHGVQFRPGSLPR